MSAISEEGTPYIPHLSKSPSLINMVGPDANNAGENKVITDAETILKLKSDNLRKEKKIQQLMSENIKLKRSARTRIGPLTLGKTQSGKIREKINDIKRNSSMSLPNRSAPLIQEAPSFKRTTTLDSIPVNIDSPPLKFEVSAQEAKERREQSISTPGLKQ